MPIGQTDVGSPSVETLGCLELTVNTRVKVVTPMANCSSWVGGLDMLDRLPASLLPSWGRICPYIYNCFST